MSELDLLFKEMEDAATHFMDLIGEMRSMFTTKEEPVAEEKKVEFTELRSLCANKSRDGFTDAVRELIHATGAKKLSEVEPNHYAELYKKVESLK